MKINTLKCVTALVAPGAPQASRSPAPPSPTGGGEPEGEGLRGLTVYTSAWHAPTHSIHNEKQPGVRVTAQEHTKPHTKGQARSLC